MLTDDMQVGGGHNVSVPIFDFIQPIILWRKSGDNDIVYWSVPDERHDTSVTQVVVHYLALTKQLDGAARRFGVEGTQRGFIWNSTWGKNEMGMMDREKQG